MENGTLRNPTSSIAFTSNNQFIAMADGFADLPAELRLSTEAHVKYIQSLDTRKDSYDYWLTEHLRLNGLYWGLTALSLLGHPEALPRDEVVSFVLSCQHDNGGFGSAPGHDAHMLSTVSAVQILAILDAFDDLEERGQGKARIGQCKFTAPTRILFPVT
jgi:geranylgeranyl transferase type-2 subunit beta